MRLLQPDLPPSYWTMRPAARALLLLCVRSATNASPVTTPSADQGTWASSAPTTPKGELRPPSDSWETDSPARQHKGTDARQGDALRRASVTRYAQRPPLLTRYSHVTRTLLARYSHVTRTLLARYSHVTRTLLARYSHVTRTLLACYSHVTHTLLTRYTTGWGTTHSTECG